MLEYSSLGILIKTWKLLPLSKIRLVLILSRGRDGIFTDGVEVLTGLSEIDLWESLDFTGRLLSTDCFNFMLRTLLLIL